MSSRNGSLDSSSLLLLLACDTTRSRAARTTRRTRIARLRTLSDGLAHVAEPQEDGSANTTLSSRSVLSSSLRYWAQQATLRSDIKLDFAPSSTRSNAGLCL